MKKTNVAVLFGGHSSEYSVSLESAYSVLCNLDRDKFNPIPIGITKEGDWYLYRGQLSCIKDGSWVNSPDCVPVLVSPNRSAHRLLAIGESGVEYLAIDCVLPILHGKNGEDGTVQGVFELAGIPIAGCNTLSSALCMDKDRAHKLAEHAGIRVPKSVVIDNLAKAGTVEEFAREVGYPVFVKPVRAGSSIGVTKVTDPSMLKDALALALSQDREAETEEFIDGFEVSCAVLGKGSPENLICGELAELELVKGFFDFTEKYTHNTCKVHIPARISPEKAEEIKELAKKVYGVLGCEIFARVDIFLRPNGELVFNEINTIPGFTELSLYPGMMKAVGISFTEVLTRILEMAQ
ncbi:MAG: D-alanine--D-serine ligase VanG [Eubacteriales bacterium]